MIPNAFEYHSPASVSEALSLLEQYGDEAKILAGGHSLLPAMKLRLASPGVLVDINKISELRGVTINGNVTIGSLTTWATIEHHDGLKQALPVLPEAVSLVGDIQVRNRGTLGGALAHADPAADITAVVLALGGELRATGPSGERSIPAEDFFTDMLTTALEPNEILTAIVLPRLSQGEGAAYVKFAHPASGYAIVGVAAYVKLDGGTPVACRVAMTGAGPKATRLSSVEQAILGGSSVADATANAGDGLDILGDIHASESYRRAMVGVYAKRALTAAMAKAGA